MNVLSQFEYRINSLTENQPLYKDSGLWQVRSDDMEQVLFWQGVNETFSQFIDRVYEAQSAEIYDLS